MLEVFEEEGLFTLQQKDSLISEESDDMLGNESLRLVKSNDTDDDEMDDILNKILENSPTRPASPSNSSVSSASSESSDSSASSSSSFESSPLSPSSLPVRSPTSESASPTKPLLGDRSPYRVVVEVTDPAAQHLLPKTPPMPAAQHILPKMPTSPQSLTASPFLQKNQMRMFGS
eukprot:11468169-Ditylum_brightwellii.AAC.1